MVTLDRIRLTGLLRRKPWKRGFLYWARFAGDSTRFRLRQANAAVSLEPLGPGARPFARGAVPATANVAPRVLVDIYESFVRGVDPSPAAIDEVMQALFEKLLVPRDGEPARLTSYAGRGPLAGWVGVAAQRMALGLRRGESAQARALAERLGAAPVPQAAGWRRAPRSQRNFASIPSPLKFSPAPEGRAIRFSKQRGSIPPA